MWSTEDETGDISELTNFWLNGYEISFLQYFDFLICIYVVLLCLFIEIGGKQRKLKDLVLVSLMFRTHGNEEFPNLKKKKMKRELEDGG